MLTSEMLSLRSRVLRRARVVTRVLAVAAIAACAPATHHDTAPRPERGSILVRNYKPEYVAIYLARRGGMIWRLGELPGIGDATFTVPRAALAVIDEVYLIARPLAGRPFQSESFLFPSGATAVWTIEGHTSLSHVALR